MKTKSSKSNYGVLVLTGSSLRRLRAEWETVEPPPPPMSLTPEAFELRDFPFRRVNEQRHAA